MAINLLTGKRTARDWSCGASDLPSSIPGVIPEKWWGPAQMEAKLNEIMNKPKGIFGGGSKPTREEGIDLLVKYMKDKKIGPQNVSGIGSLLLPAKEQARLMAKLDDLRYDIRGTRDLVGAGMFALAGGVALLGFAKIYKTAKG